MQNHFIRNQYRPFRPLRLERLEERRMLDVSAAELRDIHNAYADFEIADDVNIIEIEAENLSAAALQSAINDAVETSVDDLIVLRTTADTQPIEFSDKSDELMIDADTDKCGAITIVAYGGAPLTIDANSLSRILTIKSGSVQLGNLILTGGYAQTNIEGEESLCAVGGGIASAGTLVLDAVTVSDCAAKGIFSDSYLGFCSKGGGIYNGGILFILNSTINNNMAHSGSASSFEWAAYGAGGGIFNDVSARLTVRNTSIINNAAESETLPALDDPETKVEQFGRGGGICNYGSAAVLDGSDISHNSASMGGAVCVLTKNEPSSLIMDQTELKNNEAKDFGGAIFSGEGAVTTLTDCLVEGNSVGQYGGGIYNESPLSIKNSIITGNTSEDSGGAIYAAAYSDNIYEILLSNITVTGNSAKNSGGGVTLKDADAQKVLLTINNSILVDNRVLSAANADDDPNISSTGVINGNSTLSTFTAWSNDGGCYRYNSTIPLFLRSYDFTSKTVGDYHLAFSDISQAIDRGDDDFIDSESDFFDYDGKPRQSGASVDLGAYETQFSASTPVIVEDTYSLQAGCSVYLSAKENIDGLTYLWDLDGDGFYEEYGGEFWTASGDLNNSQAIKMRTVDQNGAISPSAQAAVSLLPDVPTVSICTSELAQGQILKIALDVYSLGGETVAEWKIDWGDGGDPEVFNSVSNGLKTAHYHVPTEMDVTYMITLEIIDTAENSAFFTLTRHAIQGQTINSQLIVGEAAALEITPLAASPSTPESLEPPRNPLSDDLPAAILYPNPRDGLVPLNSSTKSEDVSGAASRQSAESLLSTETPLGAEESDSSVVPLEFDFINDETIDDYYADGTNELETPFADSDELGVLF